MLPAATAEATRRWREALEPARAFRATAKTSPAGFHRAVRRELARRLRSLALAPPEHAPRGGDLDRLLALDANRYGLGTPAPASLSEALVEAAQSAWPDAHTERDRALAQRGLLARAAASAAALGTRPASAEVDRIRTDLLWAARLKAELVRGQLRLLHATINGRLAPAQTLEGLARSRPASASGLWATGVEAVCRAVDRFDPARGGRLAAPVGLAVGRALAACVARLLDTADTARDGPPRTDTPPADWTRSVYPWQAWLEAPPGVRAGLTHAPAADRELIAQRQGWLVSPPRTLAELAAERGGRVRATHVASAERRAMRRVLVARSG